MITGAAFLSAGPLEGYGVRLEPYAAANRAELSAALDCDPDSWLLLSSTARGEAFAPWWDGALREVGQGSRLAYVIRDLTSAAAVGTTSFLAIRSAHRAAEIGATFLRPEARGGRVNPACKLLMLEHAFNCGSVRVELVTDLRNGRSQAAIAKLGAQREGVLRKHKITWTGYVRDTVVFSITDDDWPKVKAGLEARLT